MPRLPRGKEVSDWKPVDSGLTLGMRSLCLSSLEAVPHRLNDDARAGGEVSLKPARLGLCCLYRRLIRTRCRESVLISPSNRAVKQTGPSPYLPSARYQTRRRYHPELR